MNVQQANMMQQQTNTMAQGQGMQGQGQMQPGMQAAAPQGPQTMMGKAWNFTKRTFNSDGKAAIEYRANQAEKDKVNAVNRYNEAKTKCATSIEAAHKLATNVLAPTNSEISEDINNITAPLKTPATFNMIGAQAPVQDNVTLAPGAIENQTPGPPAPNPQEVPLNTNTQQAAPSPDDEKINDIPKPIHDAGTNAGYQFTNPPDPMMENSTSINPDTKQSWGRRTDNQQPVFKDNAGKFWVFDPTMMGTTWVNVIEDPTKPGNFMWTAISQGGKRKSKKAQKKQAKRKTHKGGKKSKKQKKCNGGKKSKRRQRK